MVLTLPANFGLADLLFHEQGLHDDVMAWHIHMPYVLQGRTKSCICPKLEA